MAFIKMTKQVVYVVGKPPYKAIVPQSLATPDHNMLQHDWSSGFKVTRSYDTDIKRSSETLHEERTVILSKPNITFDVKLLGVNQATSSKILMNLYRKLDEGLPIPLYSDQSIVTATSNGTTIYCDTTNRRFFRGARLIIFSPERGARHFWE